MRIIAGCARGRTLFSPKGQNTRPTQDYVRESLFNIIQRYVPNAIVLDLFAGSGALAFESLSRGATQGVLVDSSRQAVNCIRHNALTLGFTEQITVLHGDWRTVLEMLPQPKQCFNLVFLDPPYRLTKYADMTDLLQNRRLLAQDALIVIEHHKDVLIDLSPFYVPRDYRIYGDTMMHLFAFNIGGST